MCYNVLYCILIFLYIYIKKKICRTLEWTRGVKGLKCSEEFGKIHRKTPAIESSFNNISGYRPATPYQVYFLQLHSLILPFSQYNKQIQVYCFCNTLRCLPSRHLLYQSWCEICSKLTIKTPEQWQWQWHRSGVFIVNFEHISHLELAFLLLNLNM